MAFLEKLIEKIVVKVLNQHRDQQHEDYQQQQQRWKDILGPSPLDVLAPKCAPAPTLPTSLIDEDDTWVDDDTDTLVYSWG